MIKGITDSFLVVMLYLLSSSGFPYNQIFIFLVVLTSLFINNKITLSISFDFYSSIKMHSSFRSDTYLYKKSKALFITKLFESSKQAMRVLTTKVFL